VFAPATQTQRFEIGAPDPWLALFEFGREGVWHIWIGFDHILFLLTLLLPAVLRRSAGAWRPVERFRGAFWSVARVVTAFTLAHSITLGLAASGIVALPGPLVESVIAASVVVAAVNNVRPVITRRLWAVSFAFGLVHGFGFAGALTELGLGGANLAPALAGFNLGVEAGQLAIVAVFLPLAFLVRSTNIYPGSRFGRVRSE
jgi:hypothetical protein